MHGEVHHRGGEEVVVRPHVVAPLEEPCSVHRHDLGVVPTHVRQREVRKRHVRPETGGDPAAEERGAVCVRVCGSGGREIGWQQR